ncbi:MAG: flagellar hook-basal body complex protein FliE [Gammaproteobacteria bacterium]|nr:flagellar hook-basal body complex protein FliE [Gammaproteobacteria bacterium]
MSEIDVNQLLNQMRVMAQASQAGAAGSAEAAGPQAAEGGESVDFSAMLKQSIDTVNQYQQASGDMSKAFVTGDPNTNLSDVMIAMQKASVSFEAMKQVRNKLVEAYQQVMNLSG